MATTAYIALGSNIGDRQAFLQSALTVLRQQPGMRVVVVSRFWETAPVGGPSDQGPYLNAAAQLETDLDPRALLQVLLAVEKHLGRMRHEKNGPRTIDLDLLLFGDVIAHEPDLVLPHPRMHERLFVLGPLAEIAPTTVHPEFHRNMAELLAELRHY